MPDVRGGLLAQQQPRSTLGALERTLNAFTPLGLLNTVMINPILAGAEAFRKGSTTGQLSGGDVLTMGAPGLTGGLLAPPGGAALGAGAIRPTFYSRLSEAVAEAPITKAPGSQWLGTLKNTPGVKAEELTWTGFSDWLGRQKGPVTKQAAKDFLREGQVQISEVLGGKKEPLPKAERTTSPVGMTPMMRDMFTRRMRKVRVEEPISAAEMANVRERARYEWRTLSNEIAPHVRGEDFHEGIDPHGAGPTMQLLDRIRGGDEGAVREVAGLLRQPVKEAKKAAEKNEIGTRYETYTLPGGKDYRELRLTLPGIEPKYTGGHSFPGPPTSNTVAHVRFKDRTDVNGKKTLGIEEIQSDWHEKGRTQGYASEQAWEVHRPGTVWATQKSEAEARSIAANFPDATVKRVGGNIPDAPFKQTEDWAGLALKRMIKWAADHKYDQVTWTPGKVQADRYKLSQHVEAVDWDTKNGRLYVQRKGARSGDMIKVADDITEKNLADYVGREAADKLLSQNVPHDVRTISGLDLHVGGEGMKQFYDKIMVNVANKLGKKYGAKVGVTKLGGYELGRHPGASDQEVWSLPITDAMRDEVTKKGFPLFTGGLPMPQQEREQQPGQASGLLAMDETRGLSDVIQQGQGLLHNPDLLRQMMQGLLGPTGGGGVTHPIGGSRKLSKPLNEMQYTREPSGSILRRRTISPESLQGGYMVPLVSDRATAGERGTSVGGYPIGVEYPGGSGYTRTPGGGVWAGEQPQSKALSNSILRLQETGKPVYGTPATMGERAVDFQHAISNQILQVLPQLPLTRAAKSAFNEKYRKGYVGDKGQRVTFPEFPGLNSPRLKEWVNATGERRRWLAQAMDRKQFEDLGFPNIPEMRLAVTAKEQLNLPMYASGRDIVKLGPGLLASDHPSFPVGTEGTYKGGFGTYMPMQTMYPDWYSRNVANAQPGGNWRRSFQMGGAVNAPQELNQQWVDQAMPVWNLLRSR